MCSRRAAAWRFEWSANPHAPPFPQYSQCPIPPSVLDDLGEEITGIAAPVSLCMAIVVLLVRVLNPEGDSDTGTVFIASMAYSEQVRFRVRVRWRRRRRQRAMRGMNE
jgi:hypothetical protein